MGKSEQKERDDVLRRMLKTPPAPRRPIGAQKKPEKDGKSKKDSKDKR